MTVSAQNSYISYTGNGSTSAYSWPYKLFAAGDLKVYTVVIATGVETLQTSGGAGTYDYTISVAGDYSGATVTLNNNLPTTHKVFLTRVQALEQATDYIEGDAFPAETHEQTLDKIVLQLQQHEEQLKRALKFKQSTATRSEPAIPELAANKLIKVNSAGTGFETQDTVDVSTVAGIAADITTVSGIAANVTAVAADATDIGTVATNIASVNTVATNINDVIKVADDLNEAISEVETVANDLNEATSEIEVVANNIADVNTVGNATNIANISTVAGQITPTNNISTLAGLNTEISALYSNNANITAVGTDLIGSNTIGTVATDLAGTNNIGTVAGSIANVNEVGNNMGTVNDFANRYRVVSSDPTTSLDAGDLAYNTSANALKYYNGATWEAIVAGGLTDIVQDGTPQLGGNLDVNGNSIVSVSGGDIAITPDTTGKVVIDGLNYPTADGASGQAIVTDGAGNLSFGTTSSPEVYGFELVDTDADGVPETLRLTTTNQGADSISASTYANFADVVYSASGMSWSLTSDGNLRVTI